MRVEISYKFILGFIVVIGSIVLVNIITPLTGVPPEWQQLFSVGCAILVGLVLGAAFAKAFTGNIRILTGAAHRLGEGDLSQDIEIHAGRFPDETSDLAASLNTVVHSLRELLGYIRTTAEKVTHSAQGLSTTSEQMTASTNEVAGTVEQISRGAETQSEMVERSTRLIKEIAVSIDLIASSANKLAASASETASAAQSGGDNARETMTKMKQVLADVETNGEKILAFSAQVQKVGTIVEFITGIAQKTNLLSLNATIEAARAGEYGRGFAVVAEEIRKLADSTGASASEITRLIEVIRAESADIQVSMRETIKEMDSSHQAIDINSQSFEKIIDTAKNTQIKATSIAELSQKQLSSSKNMVQTIEEIAKVVSDNAAATEEVSAVTQEQSASMEEMSHAANELSSLSEELLEVVERFKLEEATDAEVIED
ncbi:MAG: methyl-accepting chemotaxis protein [Desulfuromonadaceae bacterium]|nr:methyl-accepting chemotaxis protein [Desulfuromonadaceae bacterium]